MFKKLLIFIFYVSALIFCALVVFSHFDLYKGLANNDFTTVIGIQTFATNIVALIADIFLLITTALTFVSFILHIGGDVNKGVKKMIKCLAVVGGYFAMLMIAEFVITFFALIGKEDFGQTISNIVTADSFYMPLAITGICAVVLVFARFISRARFLSQILVIVAATAYVIMDIMYYANTMSDALTTARFYMCLITCGIAVIPGFFPNKK